MRLARLGRDLPCPLYAKVEFFNPGGSVKDRIAVNIIEEAERSGQLKPGGTVVEATSGNTGVGLAIVCAKKGYKSIFVMPDKMSQEKIQVLRAFGSKVVITPTAVSPEDPRSYYSVANRIVADTPNAILANQYHNPENPHSHYLTTGPEIWQQTQGRVTDVVIGMGTGGTISGVGRYLKEQNPDVRIIGVDPVGSLLLETWQQGHIPEEVKPKTYKVEGIGEDFLPSTLDLGIIDDVIQVGDKDSFLWARRLVKEEGIFCGGSSGTALAAAMRYARNLTADHLMVVLLARFRFSLPFQVLRRQMDERKQLPGNRMERDPPEQCPGCQTRSGPDHRSSGRPDDRCNRLIKSARHLSSPRVISGRNAGGLGNRS